MVSSLINAPSAGMVRNFVMRSAEVAQTQDGGVALMTPGNPWGIIGL